MLLEDACGKWDLHETCTGVSGLHVRRHHGETNGNLFGVFSVWALQGRGKESKDVGREA